jgi:Fic family protein
MASYPHGDVSTSIQETPARQNGTQENAFSQWLLGLGDEGQRFEPDRPSENQYEQAIREGYEQITQNFEALQQEYTNLEDRYKALPNASSAYKISRARSTEYSALQKLFSTNRQQMRRSLNELSNMRNIVENVIQDKKIQSSESLSNLSRFA